MAYLSRQKFNIRELADLPKLEKHILLIISEEILRDIYHGYFIGSGFTVSLSHFADYATISESLPITGLLIIDVKEADREEKFEFLKIVVRNFPALPVITIGQALDEKFLQMFMDLGVIGHINRKFSRPQDLVAIARTAFIS